MQPVLVLLVAGLSPSVIGEQTPSLARLKREGAFRRLAPVFPAVTCSVQATLMTGLPVSGHGIVGNGWYFRDLAEVMFWRQPEHLVAGEKIWDAAKMRDSAFTCAKMFWWYNMYSSADWSVTPRPIYTADGRKTPDCYTTPAALRDELTAKFGQFPLFEFWGPGTSIRSSKWIAEATLHLMNTRNPNLTLCYLPHLDYDLQRFGPDLSHPAVRLSLRDIDAICGEMIEAAERDGRAVIVVSEYGITPVRGAIHINRALREAGWIAVREELGRELLDAGASRAFAVADHQAAHVYVREPLPLAEVRSVLERLDGVAEVLDGVGKRALGIDHPRSGELVAIAEPDRWFSYYYWLGDARAPDFARTVDIHRKPGYDPVELFFDPAIRSPRAAVAFRLARRAAGFRQLMDVISPRDTQLVRGSHGRLPDDPAHGPVLISSRPDLLPQGEEVRATDFKEIVLAHLFPDQVAGSAR